MAAGSNVCSQRPNSTRLSDLPLELLQHILVELPAIERWVAIQPT